MPGAERGARGRILIAEDQGIVAMELEERLVTLGFEVVAVVADGRDAVRLAAELKPDLVLMDIRLANDTDGVAAAAEVRNADIPIVFLTAHADQATVERARAVGPAGYLLKPFSERLLEITIDTAVYRHRMEADEVARKRELRRVEARLAGILQYSHDAIVGVDEAQKIVVFNRGAEETFGWPAAEVLGKSLDLLLPKPIAGSHAQLVQNFAASGANGRHMAQRGDLTGRRRDGTEFPAEVSISRIDLDGDLVFTAMVRDVSVQRGLEQRFLVAQKLEAVGLLSASVAHDFNNVLSAIQCNAYLVGLDSDGEVAEAIRQIDFAVERGSALTQQLLGFVRPRARERTVFDLSTVVREMQPMLERLLGESVELTTDLDARCRVNGDSSRIEQALLNLVVNARDAMIRGGEIRVLVQRRIGLVNGHRSKDGTCVCLEIVDEGSGIPIEHQERIFDPFFTTKSANRGTGLGLATVAEVTKEHGGTVRVHSDAHGTRFEILFPLARGESLTPAPGVPVPATIVARVLVVDADEVVRHATVRVLERAGATVVGSSVGGAALIALRGEDEFDLIVCDVQVPDGPALIDALRLAKIEIPILLMTDYDSAHLEAWGGNMVSDVLRKPFRARDLLDAVGRTVARAVASTQPTGAGPS